MTHATARLLILLLQLMFPGRGRHRSAGALPVAQREGTAATPVSSRPPVRPSELLRGEDSYLIRPYVLTPEERQERRAQRGRRRALWLAVHGYDAGPRWIHGVEVAG
ncbi:hypothetical protein [Streptomyces chattanoogensis]|uniref:Uncharacterized protein n=1 Tax=Streptomyces chattanoogensis TaxID=66876 RepID=A0A0N0H3K4_9ACTN|nr:hypothetical protein [Streptomyces chattanoogensis]KPC66331.1 hypothetical protein ADL29_05225 [Streptomyces chattanoogensis]